MKMKKYMGPWLRLYVNVPRKAKVQTLPDHLFKAWINFLCLTKENGGVLPALHDVSYVLKLPIETVEQNVSQLIEARLFDRMKSGKIRPHNWRNRQFSSDSSTERVREHRKRSKDVTGNVSGNVAETVQNQIHIQTKIHKQKKKEPRADARRVPFRDHIFAELRRKGKEPVTNPGDWKAFEALLESTADKQAFELEQLKSYFTRFVESPKDFHREQGHPIRFFCSNVTGFMGENTNGTAGHPTRKDPEGFGYKSRQAR